MGSPKGYRPSGVEKEGFPKGCHIRRGQKRWSLKVGTPRMVQQWGLPRRIPQGCPRRGARRKVPRGVSPMQVKKRGSIKRVHYCGSERRTPKGANNGGSPRVSSKGDAHGGFPQLDPPQGPPGQVQKVRSTRDVTQACPRRWVQRGVPIRDPQRISPKGRPRRRYQ